MKMLEYLQTTITENMNLSEIVDIFEKMCSMTIDDDMILFETGIFSFSGKPLFYFSLVRQFPNGEDEYFQLHTDVLYSPNKGNKNFSDSVWNEDIEESIFDYIRQSDAYKYAQNDKILKVDIFMDET